jgi:UDP-glucose:glycoprotein glucosyltransferase
MAVPEGWVVQPVVAAHDLDNLRLEELPPGVKQVEASFELESLLVTGMCIDAAALGARGGEGVHPRGVQLQLGTAAAPHVVDTLVMSNLGYFQLKAAPGVWSLRLAPGRSQELYDIASAAGPASAGEGGGGGVPVAPPPPATPGAPQAVPVPVTSFSCKDMVLILRKRADRMDEDVLDVNAGRREGGGGGSVWGALGGMLRPGGRAAGAGAVARSGGGGASSAAEDDDTIHVFTVASGHMYERLQKIMVLSALKRTKSHLKFWFIENYMSPQMKAFVPVMARQYGFDYECVAQPLARAACPVAVVHCCVSRTPRLMRPPLPPGAGL